MTFWGRQSTNKSIQFKTFRTNPEHAILILPMCWGLVSITICLFIIEGQDGQTCFVLWSVFRSTNENTTAPRLHTCATENWSPYEELHHWDEILVQRLLSLSLSLLRSFSYWYLYVRALPWLFCIRGTSNEQGFDKRVHINPNAVRQVCAELRFQGIHLTD